MAFATDITLTLTYSNETITVINDNHSLINRLVSSIYSKNEYNETFDNTFVFSKKEGFDHCVSEARELGLLPC